MHCEIVLVIEGMDLAVILRCTIVTGCMARQFSYLVKKWLVSCHIGLVVKSQWHMKMNEKSQQWHVYLVLYAYSIVYCSY